MKNAIASFVVATVTLLPSIGSAQTGHPYYPMNASSQIVYQGYRIQGHWNETTMELTVTSRTPYPNPVAIQYSKTTCPMYFGNGVLFLGDHTELGISSGKLIDGGGVSSNGISYIGEAINQNHNVHIPFIPKIATNPVAGQEIQGTSRVTASCTDMTFELNLPWRYKTIGHFTNWGPFQDVWRTGLHEYGNEQFVYNYVFARNKGMVNYWFGQLLPNGTLTNAWEFYAIQY